MVKLLTRVANAKHLLTELADGAGSRPQTGSAVTIVAGDCTTHRAELNRSRGVHGKVQAWTVGVPYTYTAPWTHAVQCSRCRHGSSNRGDHKWQAAPARRTQWVQIYV